MAKAMLEENSALSKQKKDHEKYIALRALQKDQYDLESAQQDPFLNEHFGTTGHQLGDHRYNPYHFKGLKDTDREKIQKQHQFQMQEADLKKKEQKDEDRLYALQAEHLRRMQIKQDRSLKKHNRDMAQAALTHQLDQNLENKIRWKDPYGDRS